MKKCIEEMLGVSHLYQHVEYPGESFIEGDRVLQHFSKPNGATFSLGLSYSYLWSVTERSQVLSGESVSLFALTCALKMALIPLWPVWSEMPVG